MTYEGKASYDSTPPCSRPARMVMQVRTHCNTRQHCIERHCNTPQHCKVRHCNTLWHRTGTHCNTLQHCTGTHCNTLPGRPARILVDVRSHIAVSDFMARRCITCCSVLQCGAVWCSVSQCVAACCSVLQCVAVWCSVLQCHLSWRAAGSPDYMSANPAIVHWIESSSMYHI